MPARISSRQSGSRPSSAIDSRPPVLTSSTRRLRERARVYNSETKRILKDLERASSRVQPSVSDRHSSFDVDLCAPFREISLFAILVELLRNILRRVPLKDK